MSPENGNTKSGNIGRRGMLKSVLAATATLSFGKLAAVDHSADNSINPETIANSSWRPARLKVNPKGPLRM